MAKKSKKSIYKCGGKMANGGQVAATQDVILPQNQFNLGQYSGLGNMTGSLLETTNSPVGTIGGGVLKGAASGAALGPIGAGVGAVLGGIGGIIKNKQNKEAEELQNKMMTQQANLQSLQNFQNANKMYREGGSLNQDANITQYNGLTHEQGGLPLGENTEVESGETRGTMNTQDYVFSDSLRPDKKSKKTFADISKDIEKKYKNYNNDKFAVKAKDMELSKLMYEQEAYKKNKLEEGIKNVWAKYGGFVGQNDYLAYGGGINPGEGIKDPYLTNNPDSAKSANQYIESLQEPMFNSLKAQQEYAKYRSKDADFQKGYQGGANFAKNNMILSNKQVMDYATYWDELPVNIANALSPMDLERIKSIKSKMRYGGNIMDGGGSIDPPGGGEPTKTTKKTSQYQRGSIQDYTDEAKAQYNKLTSELYKGNPGVKEYLGYHMLHSDNPEYAKMLVTKTPYSGEDRELGYYYPDIDDNRNVNDYYKRPVKYPITEKQYIANPDAYSAFMSPTRRRELDEYLLGKKPESQVINAPKLKGNEVTNYVQGELSKVDAPKVHELDVRIKNKFGGYVKMDDGGPLPYDTKKVKNAWQNYNMSQPNPEPINLPFESPYYGTPLDVNNVSLKQNLSPKGDTPQYKTNPYETGFKYNPSNTQEGMRFNKPGQHWTNDKTNTYTPEYVWSTLKDRGFTDAQLNEMQQKGWLDQFFTYEANRSGSDFSKSQYKDDDRFGPEHMMALAGNKYNIGPPDVRETPLKPLQPKGFNLEFPPKEPSLDQMRHDLTGGPPDSNNGNPPDGDGGGKPPLKPFGPDWVATGVSMLPNIGMGIGNLALANRLKFDRTNAEIINPDYVDPTRAIQETRNQYAGAKDLIRQNAGSSGSYLSNMLGATAGQSEAEAGIQSQYDNTNAGIYNQSAQFNAQNKQHANDANAQIQMQEMMQKTNLRQQGYQNLSDAANTGINTYYQSKRDADKMNLAGGENFYYKRIGSLANQKPVKVFKGNGYHYYEDPITGQMRFIDPNTGKIVKDTKKTKKFNEDLSSSKVNANNVQASKYAELQFAYSQMTPEQQQEYLSQYVTK